MLPHRAVTTGWWCFLSYQRRGGGKVPNRGRTCRKPHCRGLRGLRTGGCSGSTDSVFKVGGSDPPHRARQSHSSGLWRRAGCQVRSAIRLIRGSVRSDRKAAGPRTSVSCRLMPWLATRCGGSPRWPALTARNARVFQSLRMERDRQRALVYVAGSCDTTGTTRHVRAFPRTKTRPVRNNYCGAASRAETAKGLPRNGFSCEFATRTVSHLSPAVESR